MELIYRTDVIPAIERQREENETNDELIKDLSPTDEGYQNKKKIDEELNKYSTSDDHYIYDVKRVHCIDGNLGQIQMTLHPGMQQMFANIDTHVVKYPASLSELAQPNDLSICHRELKRKCDYTHPIGGYTNDFLHIFLQDKLSRHCSLDKTKQTLLLNFIKHGRPRLIQVYKIENIQAGYRRAGYFPYRPLHILEKCRNLDVQRDLGHIIDFNTGNFKDMQSWNTEIRTYGRVRDEFFDLKGVPERSIVEKGARGKDLNYDQMIRQGNFMFADFNENDYDASDLEDIKKLPDNTFAKWIL